MDMFNVKQLYDEISKTVVGQEAAKKTICSALYFHFVRFCMTIEANVCEIPGDKQSGYTFITEDMIPDKTNALLMGPTGSGKTFLVREAIKAMRRLLSVPYICPLLELDCTELSARGWEGDNLSDKLIGMHSNCTDTSFASGVVFLDEFDKICMTAIGKGGHDHNKTTQYNLLKPIEGCIIETRRGPFSTDNLLFILAGNFAEIRHKRKDKKKFLGFNSPESTIQQIDYHVELDSIGMVTQLVGRTPHVAELNKLTKQNLRAILDSQIIPKFSAAWEYTGKELKIKSKDKNKMVDKCYDRGTGARGLNADLVVYLEAELFKDAG